MRHETLTFARHFPASPQRLWRAWTDPAARAIWAAPAPQVSIEFLRADTRTGGQETSICRAPGMADIHAEVRWLLVRSPDCTVNTEAITQDGSLQSLALVTAEIGGSDDDAHLGLTVQLVSLAGDMAAGYRDGFTAALGNIGDYLARADAPH